MTEGFAPANDVNTAEASLRHHLARGDMVMDSIGPVLRHLLTSDEQSLFSEDVIATVRGMLFDIARQLLDASDTAAGHAGLRPDRLRVEVLSERLIGLSGLLNHLHAVALEAQLAARLEVRFGVDPVLSPLLQALIGANAVEIADAAMAFLAAQARFSGNCRRMQLPLGELPGELLHALLMDVQQFATAPISETALVAIKANYDEGRSRLGLLARLVAGLGGGATAALSLPHAGAAIFLSALAQIAGQERDAIVPLTNESQIARLGLVLRAAGLSQGEIAKQIEILHPDSALPPCVEDLSPARAAMLVAHPAPGAGF